MPRSPRLEKHKEDQRTRAWHGGTPGRRRTGWFLSCVLQPAPDSGRHGQHRGKYMWCVPMVAKSLALDLKRLDNIVHIDEENLSATIQPHVSFARLQAETMRRGLWNGGTPLAPSNVGILSNMMFNANWQSAPAYGQGMRSLINLKVILPNGDILNTGSGLAPGQRLLGIGTGS